jgi:hypothetical protein
MRYTGLLLMVSLLTSCATITRGRDEVIAIDSNPSGANAMIGCDGGVSARGTTPARLTIPRKAEGCHIKIEKSGMRPQNIGLERGFNSSYWMNFIPASGMALGVISAFSDGGSETGAGALFAVGLAGAAGLIVDRVTGAMYDHSPHVIKVTLQSE